MVQTGRHFYERHNAFPLYEHSHFVVGKEVSSGIVEPKIIADPRAEPERRKINHVVAQTAMYHVLKPDYLDMPGLILPAALRDEDVAEQIAVFSKLTELERSGAPLSAYASLLDNGKAHPALLVKLADYAVTHKMEDHIDGLVSRTSSPLFRLYKSVADAKAMMRMDAMAGEKLWGPVAELFGYPSIAGDILEHAYRINHPDIYQKMIELSTDEMTLLRLAPTQAVATEISRILRNVLTSYGFEIDIEMRKHKHHGKAMKKALRVIEEEWEDKMERDWENHGKGIPLGEYIRAKISAFTYDQLHDCVALRVILRKFRGQDMDELLGMEDRPVGAQANHDFNTKTVSGLLATISVKQLRLAVKIVSETLTGLMLASPSLKNCLPNITYVEKPNGYRAFHFDTKSYAPDAMRIFPFEIQLKTSEWHNVAEHGKAAHYYYLGGDTEFVDLVRKAYHDLIHKSKAA